MGVGAGVGRPARGLHLSRRVQGQGAQSPAPQVLPGRPSPLSPLMRGTGSAGPGDSGAAVNSTAFGSEIGRLLGKQRGRQVSTP